MQPVDDFKKSSRDVTDMLIAWLCWDDSKGARGRVVAGDKHGGRNSSPRVDDGGLDKDDSEEDR